MELWFPQEADVVSSIRSLDGSVLRASLATLGAGNAFVDAFQIGTTFEEASPALIQAFSCDDERTRRWFLGNFQTEGLVTPAMARRLATASLARTHYSVGALTHVIDPLDNRELWGVGLTVELAENWEHRLPEHAPQIHLAAKSDEEFVQASFRFRHPWPSLADQLRLSKLLTLNLLLALGRLDQIPLDVGGLALEGQPPARKLGGLASDELVEFPMHSERFILEPARASSTTPRP